MTLGPNVHPVAALFPLLEGDELRALADDIAVNGLHQPITFDLADTLLDGRNRLAACRLAGVTPSRQTYTGDDPVGFIVSQNIKRRHLNPGQRAFLALELLPFYEAQTRLPRGRPSPGKPVARVQPIKSNELAAKAAGAGARNVSYAKALDAEAPELAAEVKAGVTTIKDAASTLNKRRAKQRYLTRQDLWDAAANRAGDIFDVRHGDFRKILADVEPGSVDAIITDPPYADEFMPLWSDLAELAVKVLRPGAPLLAWSGKHRLPEVLGRLVEHLEYGWVIMLDLPGSNTRFRHTNMIQTWKPIIVVTAGKWGPHEWYLDRVVSPKPDQTLHDWQQNADPAAELIKRYVPAGGLVVDPFCGAGSFGVAAVRTGRRFLGAELDEDYWRTSRARIAEALP